MKQKSRPFASLSRRKRRVKTLEVKNLIHRERYRCGGLFYDNCDMVAATSRGNWKWSDILFLGRDPAVFWNAEIITISAAFNDRVESTAFNEASLMLKDDELQYDFFYTSKCSQFSGLTFMEYLKKREQEIAHKTPPIIRYGYRILQGYTYGIGLQIIVNADVLSRGIIESAIIDFTARGEQEWLSDEVLYTNIFQENC